MGTDKRIIEIDDEDILNLKNAEKRIMDTLTPNYEPLEIFTIQSIINKYECSITLKNKNNNHHNKRD